MYMYTYTCIFPIILISSLFPRTPVRDVELRFLEFYKRKLNLSSFNPLLQRISFLQARLNFQNSRCISKGFTVMEQRDNSASLHGFVTATPEMMCIQL